MAIIVLVKRTFEMVNEEEMAPLIAELHSRAKKQPGYIAAWRLRNIDNPNAYLIASRWETVDEWNTWFQSKERRGIQGKIDSLIGEKTFYETYDLLEG